MFHNARRVFAVLVICAVGLTVLAQQSSEEKKAAFIKEYEKVMAGKGDGGKFMGTKLCRACHTTKKSGAQFKIWSKGPHAKAHQALLSDEGKKRASAKNVAKPEEDKNCLQCHSPLATLPKELLSPKAQVSEGVGCEICHGPAETHVAREKEALKKRTSVPPDQRALLKVSDPEKKVALCARCHKQHEWHEMKERDHLEAWKEIAHMRPKE